MRFQPNLLSLRQQIPLHPQDANRAIAIIMKIPNARQKTRTFLVRGLGKRDTDS